MPPWSPRSVLWSCLVLALLLVIPAFAQSSTSSPSPSASISLSLTTSSTTVTTTIHSGNRDITTTTVIPTVFNVTSTITPTQSSSTSASAAAASTSAPPDYTQLDTHVDPGFGVLGAVLILTGLPSAFLGHKNRWTSFFLIGFYTLSLVCFVLILRFGVIQAINPPNKTLRGLFVLSSGVAGIAGGGIAIFFWKASKYFIGAWGGFALALWIQCFRDGGLIGPLGYRWIMYIAISVIGFVLCTLPKLHYYILLLSTAFVGATAFMLGVDCYTAAGLKEFYVWNIGFEALFTKFQEHGVKFPVTQVMQIELGMMGAVSIMGMAVQFQIFKILLRKMREIEAERKREDQAAEVRAAERFKDLDLEKEDWDLRHPSLLKHGRADSNLSGKPLLGKDGSPTIDLDSPLNTPRPRYQSGLSEFMAAPTPQDELDRAASKKPRGFLPDLDLGDHIEPSVPEQFISSSKAESDGSRASKSPTPADAENLKRREDLLSEIQTIRRSIELLRGETPVPSVSTDSRHPSVGSRPISQDLTSLTAAPTAHLRPPRERDPRVRVQSMGSSDLSQLSYSDVGASIGRPTSAPLRNDNWDTYLLERKLLQPPSGVTAPIPTTPISPPPPKVSSAVLEALKDRHRRESALSGQVLDPDSKRSSSDDLPLAPRLQHRKTSSQGGHIPVTILPPQRLAEPKPAKAHPPEERIISYEELEDRHRRTLNKMQAPITRTVQEEHEVTEARSRWERAKENEKQVMAKKEAQAQEKGRKSNEQTRGRREAAGDAGDKKHGRSLSADILTNMPGAQTSTKRMSTMKVEDWLKEEQGSPPHARKVSATTPRRESGVPFPESPRDRASRRISVLPREPVS